MRVLIAQINPTIGAIELNRKKIEESISFAKAQKVDLVVFPELALTGYFPDDLLYEPRLLDRCKEALDKIIEATDGISVVLGTVRRRNGLGKKLFNSAAIIENRHLIGFQDKMLLPTYDVFDERRYFEPSEEQYIWHLTKGKIAVTICEDIWHEYPPSCLTSYKKDPVAFFIGKNIDLFVNISASPYAQNKRMLRKKLFHGIYDKLQVPLVFCNQVTGQDALIFDGSSMAIGKKNAFFFIGEAAKEALYLIDYEKNEYPSSVDKKPMEELFHVLALGVRDYFKKQGFHKALLGLSGGVDSAVVAAILVHALGKEHVCALYLPSRFNSISSKEDAYFIAAHLGITLKEIPIEPIFQKYLDLFTTVFEEERFGTAEENVQARIRANILMAFTNKEKSLLVATSNKSEFAIGYSTLYGDAAGALNPIGDLLKTEVYALAHWLEETFHCFGRRVLEKPPTAELRLDQKDSDTLPEYPLLDSIIEKYIVQNKSGKKIAEELNIAEDFVLSIIQRIHKQEYKRRQSPFALRVSEKCFSFGRRVPIVESIL